MCKILTYYIYSILLLTLSAVICFKVLFSVLAFENAEVSTFNFKPLDAG